MNRNIIGIAVVALSIGAIVAPVHAKSHVRTNLTPTGADADASGRATLALKSASDGKFEIAVRHLDRDTTYEVIVGGVRVADLVTTGGGNGKVRFRSRPRNDRDVALGFDPRNATVVVRSAAGDDVLATTFPDDAPANDGDVVCCIPDDSGPECEDRTADECAAQGGTVVAGATSCLPNPCEGATPVGDDGDIVCCIPDDSGAECEDRTQTECLAAGGTVVAAKCCDPNPCAAVPPTGGEIVCCLPDNGGDGANECEDLSADACTAAGGTVSDATSCTPDPCNTGTPPADEIACCVPSATDVVECETLTADACAAAGGSAAPTATCTPDPCGGTSGGDGSGGQGGPGGGDDPSGHN
jgi:hypothetical protein